MGYCPMFVDYFRDCVDYILKVKDIEAFKYCFNKNFIDCPFYKVVNNIAPICPSANSCRKFEYMAIENFSKFLEMTEEYCLSENYMNCKDFNVSY